MSESWSQMIVPLFLTRFILFIFFRCFVKKNILLLTSKVYFSLFIDTCFLSAESSRPNEIN